MIPVRQSEALRTGALAGAGQVGAVVGTAGGLLTALVNILTAAVSQQAVAALTAALTTHLTQILTRYTKISLSHSCELSVSLSAFQTVLYT